MSSQELKEIVARRLEDFRKRLGLSQAQLASKMEGLTKSTIEKIERADMIPTPQTLARLADALDVAKEELLRPYIIDVDYNQVRYRKRSKMPIKKVEELQRKYMLKLERYVEVERLLGESVTFQMDFSNVDVRTYQDAQKVALMFRKEMGWDMRPIVSPIQQLEQKGVKVFILDDEESNKDFDGMCYKENGIAVVVLKDCNHAEHDRFTLFHEMGHLLMNTGDIEGRDLEALCNAFASEVLLPEPIFRQHFHEGSRIYPITLQMLQREWGISTDAQMYKAKALGIVTENRYIGYCVRLNRNKELKEDMQKSRFVAETTDRYKTLIYRALSEYKLSTDKAAKMLDISIEVLDDQISLANA